MQVNWGCRGLFNTLWACPTNSTGCPPPPALSARPVVMRGSVLPWTEQLCRNLCKINLSHHSWTQFEGHLEYMRCFMAQRKLGGLNQILVFDGFPKWPLDITVLLSEEKNWKPLNKQWSRSKHEDWRTLSGSQPSAESQLWKCSGFSDTE